MSAGGHQVEPCESSLLHNDGEVHVHNPSGPMVQSQWTLSSKLSTTPQHLGAPVRSRDHCLLRLSSFSCILSSSTAGTGSHHAHHHTSARSRCASCHNRAAPSLRRITRVESAAGPCPRRRHNKPSRGTQSAAVLPYTAYYTSGTDQHHSPVHTAGAYANHHRTSPSGTAIHHSGRNPHYTENSGSANASCELVLIPGTNLRLVEDPLNTMPGSEAMVSHPALLLYWSSAP